MLDLDAVGPFVGALALCSSTQTASLHWISSPSSVLPRPEVINAWIVTGEVDVVLNVMTRTVGEYEQILRELQQAFPQLKSVRTLVTLTSAETQPRNPVCAVRAGKRQHRLSESLARAQRVRNFRRFGR